jgi:hypothetical protein
MVFVLNNIYSLLSCIFSLYTVGNISSVTKESSRATLKTGAAHFFHLIVPAYLHRVTSNKTGILIIIAVKTSNVQQRNKFLCPTVLLSTTSSPT